MKKKLKKGFTIVELVIVIAVIAVLTAVLIPTFSSLINKAHQSADVMTVRNMNVALQSSENNFQTLEEVKSYLENEGFSKSTNASTAGNYFVWDRTNNQMLIATNDGKVAKGVWPENYVGKTSLDGEWYRYVDKVVNVNATELENYAVTEFQPTLRLTDNAENKVIINGIANLDLTGHTLQNGLEINSNDKGGFYVDYGYVAGEEFKVNTPNATFIHSKDLTINVGNSIINVANNSYHLFGKIITNTLELKGVTHVVLNEEAVFAPIAVKVESSANPTITTVVGEEKATLTKAQLGFTAETTEVSGASVLEIVEEKTQQLEPEITGTEVRTEQELRDALAAGGNIFVMNDILTATSKYIAQKPFKLYGNNHSIKVTTTQAGQRVIDMDAEDYPALSGGEYIFKDVKLLLDDNASNTRVVSTYALKNAKLLFENVEMSKAFYALNIPSQTSNLDIVVKNCHFTGWAAINSYASKSSITVIDSILEGINDKSYNADGWNNFAVIVIDGGSYVNMKTSRNVVVNIVNSQIIAQTNENSAGNANTEYLLSLQYNGNTDDVYCTNCTFISRRLDKENVLTETVLDPENDNMPINVVGNTHRIYLNGEKVL